MEHKPVLLEESIAGLSIKPDGVYCDATLGRAGHASRIAEKLGTGRLIAIDRDAAAIEEAGAVLERFGSKVTLVHGNFGDIVKILDELGIDSVDGMLFDFGTSSPQLDDTQRGFSYTRDALLDMRMDKNGSLTAHEIVNEWSGERLREILYKYGEERHSARIVRAIMSSRSEKPIETTLELTEIIVAAMPAAARRERQHPAKRTFQAIRIAVNDELGEIGRMLETAPDKLGVGGRICVISFHSLEDRLVKNGFAVRERGCMCPPDFPRCVCGFKPTLKTITKKPITPTDGEVNTNPRARSAKLRIAERV